MAGLEQSARAKRLPRAIATRMRGQVGENPHKLCKSSDMNRDILFSAPGLIFGATAIH